MQYLSGLFHESGYDRSIVTKAIRFMGVFIKVCTILSIEAGFFPLGVGFLIDYCAMTIFHQSFQFDPTIIKTIFSDYPILSILRYFF